MIKTIQAKGVSSYLICKRKIAYWNVLFAIARFDSFFVTFRFWCCDARIGRWRRRYRGFAGSCLPCFLVVLLPVLVGHFPLLRRQRRFSGFAGPSYLFFFPIGTGGLFSYVESDKDRALFLLSLVQFIVRFDKGVEIIEVIIVFFLMRNFYLVNAQRYHQCSLFFLLQKRR